MEPSLNFNSFIGKRFQGHKIQKLASMIDHLKHGQIIPRGTLVIIASGNTHLQLKILEKIHLTKDSQRPYQSAIVHLRKESHQTIYIGF